MWGMDVGDGCGGWMDGKGGGLGHFVCVCVCVYRGHGDGRERLWLGLGWGRGANAGWVFELLSYDAYKGLPKKKKERQERK